VALSRAWIFSPRADLALFGGTAAFSIALLGVGAALGLTRSDSPEWTWILGVLLVDVAHVWSTGLLVLDPVERARHGRLWLAVPLVAYAAGVALYAAGAMVFWRALAYLAVWHFVRQQWGWMAIYRARGGETDRVGRWLDAAAIYAATLYPLVYWHAHLPRRFAWFMQGDFAALPQLVARVALPVYLAIMASYAWRALARWRAGRGTPGKDLLVLSTAACWWLGIIAFDSDYAFTVTNVFVHGVPYVALILVVARARGVRLVRPGGATPLLVVVGALWAVAFVEELLWDRAVWHERGWLFGDGWQGLDDARVWLVPLLAVPQLAHYILDGFIWRRGHREPVPLAWPSASPGQLAPAAAKTQRSSHEFQ
jgi:hypothetical protein